MFAIGRVGAQEDRPEGGLQLAAYDGPFHLSAGISRIEERNEFEEERNTK